MSRGPTHIFALAEDKEHRNLIYRFVKRCKLNDPRFVKLPSGKGSGEQFVRQQFPEELKKLRSSLGHKVGAMLIVMVDADLKTVPQRRAEFSGMTPDDPVVILIPKRHVETWIAALNGETVNEGDDYKAGFRDRDAAKKIASAAETLYAHTRPNAPVPENFPPSLQASIPEWQRIG